MMEYVRAAGGWGLFWARFPAALLEACLLAL